MKRMKKRGPNVCGSYMTSMTSYFSLYRPYMYICVHYRFVRFSYCIDDQFIKPHGFSGSLPRFVLLCIIVLSLLLREINSWWWWWCYLMFSVSRDRFSLIALTTMG